MSLKYKKINTNKVNQLFGEIVSVRNSINETFATPKKKLPDLQKSFELDGLDKFEDFLLIQLATEKGLIKFSDN